MLADAKIPALRKEIDSLRERLRYVDEIFSDNEDSFNVVAQIALSLQACETVRELDESVGVMMVSKSADHACFYILSSDIAEDAAEYIRSINSLPEELQTRLIKLNKTVCESCRAETYQELLGIELDSPASVALVPVNFKELKAVLVIGALDPDYYTQEVGTVFLDFLGASLAISANRILVNPTES